jgi:hypothetical protein
MALSRASFAQGARWIAILPRAYLPDSKAFDVGGKSVSAGTRLALPRLKRNREMVCGAKFHLKGHKSTWLDGIPAQLKVIEEKHDERRYRASKKRVGTTETPNHR